MTATPKNSPKPGKVNPETGEPEEGAPEIGEPEELQPGEDPHDGDEPFPPPPGKPTNNEQPS